MKQQQQQQQQQLTFIPSFSKSFLGHSSSLSSSSNICPNTNNRNIVSIHQKRKRTVVTCTIAPSVPEETILDMESDAEPVKEIHGTTEYLNVMQEHKENLVVIKIFTHWCRSCKALQPKMNRLARQYKHIKFFKMNYEENKQLCKQLNIYSIPTILFYYGELEVIDKFTCGPMRTSILQKKIEEIERGYCLLNENRDKQVKQPAYSSSNKS